MPSRTYLQLAQGVARESGTAAGTIASVTGQTGRLLKIVNWTAQALERIENLETGWRWMRTAFPSTCVTIAGTIRYTAAGWSITNLGEWLVEDRLVTIYNSSTGVSDEGEVPYLDWSEFDRQYLRGSQTNNRPGNWSISPQNEFCLGPPPDAVYRVNSWYRRTAEALTANDDVPDMPARFHDMIMWLGVIMLNEFDGGVSPLDLARAQMKYDEYLFALRRDQLPRVTIRAKPLA